VISILAAFLLFFTIYKLGRLKYILSFNQLLSLTVVVSVYLSVRSTTDITYDKFSCSFLSRISYLDVIIFLISFFLIYGLIRSFQNWIKKFLIVKSESKNYFEDTPVVSDIKKTEQANQIVELISSSNFKGSFSVGIMGTWGHGKSSFINGIKESLVSSAHSQDIILVNFSPFLNHKEEDIISEFFTSFSGQLGRYSGSLSKSLMDYASSISKLYKRGEKVSFLDEYRFTNEKPAYELYLKINQQISGIGKKIVVFIDDLDRLSAREILEVFKLIRNTSNFNNTIFIIALDKTYVINSLNEKSISLEVKFIDKFFQLEVFLPEISLLELSNHLLGLLEKSNKIDEENIDIVRVAINKPSTLFDRYVKNFRDCVRLANQIIYDHLVMKDLVKEIDANDFLNLIFLRSRFPEIYSDLLQNREKYLEHFDRKFSLIEKDGKSKGQLIRVNLNRKPILDISRFELNDKFKGTDTNLEHNFSSDERQLLLETLVSMFGKESPSPNSIMWEYNFFKIIKLRYSENDLRDSEFNELVSLDFDSMKPLADSLLKRNKGVQLLDRLPFYTIRDSGTLKSVIQLYFYLFKKATIYLLPKEPIKDFLFFYLNENGPNKGLEQGVDLNTLEKKAIVNNFFSDKEVNLKERIDLLVEVSNSQHNTDFWGMIESDLNVLSVDLMKEFFSKYEGEIWDINNFELYRHFHSLKEIGDKDEIIALTKEYLTRNDISVFCFQLLDQEPFVPHLYKLSEFAKELFGSYFEFNAFVDSHKQKEDAEILKFRKFIELFLIAGGRNKNIKFPFSDNKLLQNKKDRRDYSKRDQKIGETTVQVFVKIDELLKPIKPVFENRYHAFVPVYNLKYNDENYMMFTVQDLEGKSGILDFIFESFEKHLVSTGVSVIINKSGKYELLDEKGKTLMKEFSNSLNF
jgi:hypothetical protein